jgi:hypothetical protein
MAKCPHVTARALVDISHEARTRDMEDRPRRGCAARSCAQVVCRSSQRQPEPWTADGHFAKIPIKRARHICPIARRAHSFTTARAVVPL